MSYSTSALCIPVSFTPWHCSVFQPVLPFITSITQSVLPVHEVLAIDHLFVRLSLFSLQSSLYYSCGCLVVFYLFLVFEFRFAQLTFGFVYYLGFIELFKFLDSRTWRGRCWWAGAVRCGASIHEAAESHSLAAFCHTGCEGQFSCAKYNQTLHHIIDRAKSSCHTSTLILMTSRTCSLKIPIIKHK